MNIQQAQLIASEELRKNYRKPMVLNLLRTYAVVELKKVEEANQFAKDFERLEKTKIDQAQLDRFFTWYYINYITGSKSGLLTTETVTNISFFHFLEIKDTERQGIYEAYAKEQLELEDEKASQYSLRMTKAKTFQADDQFCIWYYINHITNRR